MHAGDRWDMGQVWSFCNGRLWRSPQDTKAMNNLLAAALRETGPLRFRTADGMTCVAAAFGREVRLLDDATPCPDAEAVPAPDFAALVLA